MDEAQIPVRKKAKGTFLCFTVTSQIIFIAIILLTVIAFKLFKTDLYKKAKAEYKARFSVETTVGQVLGNGDKNEI